MSGGLKLLICKRLFSPPIPGNPRIRRRIGRCHECIWRIRSPTQLRLDCPFESLADLANLACGSVQVRMKLSHKLSHPYRRRDLPSCPTAVASRCVAAVRRTERTASNPMRNSAVEARPRVVSCESHMTVIRSVSERGRQGECLYHSVAVRGRNQPHGHI